MSELNQTEEQVPAKAETQAPTPVVPAAAPAPAVARPPFLMASSGRDQRGGGARGGNGRGGAGGGARGGRAGGPGRGNDRRGPRRDGDVPAEADYIEKNLEVARVTRVTKGGKRMRFRVLSVIGNQKGRVGYGQAKGVDVAGATAKSTAQARKSLITVPMVNDTIPHEVSAKFRAARVILKPAPKGTGVKSGGAIRPVLELAGIQNVVSKMLGSSNKTNNVKATIMALKQLRLQVKKGEKVDEGTGTRTTS
ncbi:30S ribosomal protein S5 [Patescibacteria group bacterium]|nr:30S ribosomal protein S5 [Patescibacteria group bacterium]